MKLLYLGFVTVYAGTHFHSSVTIDHTPLFCYYRCSHDDENMNIWLMELFVFMELFPQLPKHLRARQRDVGHFLWKRHKKKNKIIIMTHKRDFYSPWVPNNVDIITSAKEIKWQTAFTGLP